MTIRFLPNDPLAGPPAPPLRRQSPLGNRPASRAGFVVAVGGLVLRFSATAARMRAVSAAALTVSPSRMSIARLTFPSRLELNKRLGSFNKAPFANVSLTTCL